jgi:hypothetical protein
MKNYKFIFPVLVVLAGCYSIPCRDAQGNKRELKSDINLEYSKSGFSAEVSSIEKEIQSLKPSLKTSIVTSVQLKSGGILVAAVLQSEKDEGESENIVADFYLKFKNSQTWVFIDHIDLEGASFEFHKDGILKISVEEGGTSRSKTSVLWKIENGIFKLIGQDSEVYESWALNTKSKTAPFKTTTSTNFIAGKTIVTSEFADGKVTHQNCKFEAALFKNKKLSAMASSGIEAPSCPPKKKEPPKPAETGEIKKLDGKWKLTDVKCTEGFVAVPEGVEFAGDIKSARQIIFVTLNNGNANYEGTRKLKNSEGICHLNRTEKWSLRGKVLTVSDTVETESGKDPVKDKCTGRQSISAARNHKLSFLETDKFEILLDSNFPTYCYSSNQKMTYEKVKILPE